MVEHMFEHNQWANPDADYPALAAAIAELPSPEPGGDAIACGGRVRSLLILQRRLQSCLLEQVASFDAQAFGTAFGSASTQAWVRAYGSLDSSQASALVGAARLTATLPLVAGVFARGEIGVEHLVAIERTTRAVPDDVLACHDAVLTSLAEHGNPRDMARAGEKITEVWQHDTLAADPSAVLDVRRLSLAQTMDGIWSLDGQLTPEDGAKLAAALEPLMRKRGPEDDRTPQQRRADALTELVDIALRSGDLPQSGGDRTRITLLVHLTEQAIDAAQQADEAARAAEAADGEGDPRQADPPAVAPDGQGLAPTEVEGAPVQPRRVAEPSDSADGVASRSIGDGGQRTALRRLAGAVTGEGSAGLFAGSRVAAIFDGRTARQLLGSQAALSQDALTRIACDADINLALLGPTGDLLYQGRTCRFPTVAQSRALVVRDRGCVFPGCDRPPSKCQAHHLLFWGDLGPTDIDNLALVCGFHHMVIHDQHWQLGRLPVTAESAYGGWTARSPRGLVVRHHRQRAA